MKSKSLKLDLTRLKEIFIPLLVLLVTVFLTAKFLYPKIIQITEFHQQLKKNEVQVESLEKKANLLENQKNDNLLGSFEKLQQILPNEKDVAGLLVSFEFLKKDSDVVFGKFDLKPGLLATESAQKTSQQQEFEFQITLSGAYENLVSFLKRVENAAPITSIEKAQITFQSGKEDVRANLQLRAYYFPLEEEKLKMESPLPVLSSSLKQVHEQLLKFEIFTYVTFLPLEEIGKDNPFSF
ncbi:type 4a pilus biogenesis protein PilO [Candidatus Microgenomates bacterium]|nr:type 4a pilus biogenesis protein PilO [Candidatus Microgenomates bacterium]